MTTNTAAKVTIEIIRDCEGDGRCGACGREGLRWVAQLSDGSNVGLECAKRVLGFKPAPKSYNWQAAFTLTETRRTYGAFWGLWVSESGKAAAVTLNGNLQCSGGAEWVRKQFEGYTR